MKHIMFPEREGGIQMQQKKLVVHWEKSLRTPDAEDIFLHKSAKFHVKTIIRSKVMKVCTQSLKNATELKLSPLQCQKV